MNAISNLQKLGQLDGFVGAAIADLDSGMTLEVLGGGESLNIEVAAAVNMDVIKAKYRAMKELGIEGGIEDILITLKHQYHLIRPSAKHDQVFIYLALDKDRANLAMARLKLKGTDAELTI